MSQKALLTALFWFSMCFSKLIKGFLQWMKKHCGRYVVDILIRRSRELLLYFYSHTHGLLPSIFVRVARVCDFLSCEIILRRGFQSHNSGPPQASLDLSSFFTSLKTSATHFQDTQVSTQEMEYVVFHLPSISAPFLCHFLPRLSQQSPTLIQAGWKDTTSVHGVTQTRCLGGCGTRPRR